MNVTTAIIFMILVSIVFLIIVNTNKPIFYVMLIGTVGLTGVIKFICTGSGPKQVPPEEMRKSIQDFKTKHGIPEYNTPKMFQDKEMEKWTS